MKRYLSFSLLKRKLVTLTRFLPLFTLLFAFFLIPISSAEVIVVDESEGILQTSETKTDRHSKQDQEVYLVTTSKRYHTRFRLQLTGLAPTEQPQRSFNNDSDPVGLMDWVHPQLGLSLQFNHYLGLEYQFTYLRRTGYAENTPNLNAYGMINRLASVFYFMFDPVTIQIQLGFARTDLIDSYDDAELNFGKALTTFLGLRALYAVSQKLSLFIEVTGFYDAHNYQQFNPRSTNDDTDFEDQEYPMTFVGLGAQ